MKPKHTPFTNFVFESPAAYITAIITERGVFKPHEIGTTFRGLLKDMSTNEIQEKRDRF